MLSTSLSIAQSDITIQWKNEKAVAIIIPISKIDHYSKDPNSDLFFKVKLKEAETAMLGKTTRDADRLIFTPVLAFTPGMTYDITWKKKRIGFVLIPPLAEGKKPSLVIYPSMDTLPANLLKVYLQFSQPMQEDHAYDFIRVVKNAKDTVAVFLELQPALWNEDQTRLTLWLDPGRIKRDLGPNKAFGKPLDEGNTYTLIISARWKDKRGMPLQTNYTKNFYASTDDRLIPKPDSWKLLLPASGTRELLKIDFGEPMDYSLGLDALQVLRDNVPVKGLVALDEKELRWNFSPELVWQPGKYKIKIESRLEDLAGNNLNRPFDKDLLLDDNTAKEERLFYVLEFVIPED